MQQYIEQAQQMAAEYAPRLLAAVAVLVFGWIAIRIVRGTFRRVLVRARIEGTLASFLTSYLLG